jgi:hypothetical protein
VPLSIKVGNATGAGQPITAGIPFPKGRLEARARLSLSGPEGQKILLQTLPLARWSDGSVKWLLLDFVLPSSGSPSGDYILAPEPFGWEPDAAACVFMADVDGDLVVQTGAATFCLHQAQVQLNRVLVGTKELLPPNSYAILLTDARGMQLLPRVERLSVEASGPVRATVKYEGTFAGRLGCRFIARFCFFAGTGLMRIRFTIHNPNRACHRGNLWDLGDPNSVLFRDLSLKLTLPDDRQSRLFLLAEPGREPQAARRERLEIFQASSGGSNWASKNHVNRLGQVPCPFRGYRVRRGDEEQRGLRASPVLGLDRAAGTVTVAIPEFWQQFPKALRAEGRELRVQWFPEQWGDLFELQGGEQKTHTAWLHFGPPASPASLPLRWVHDTAQVCAPAEWYGASAALPFAVDVSSQVDGPLARNLAEILDGQASLVAKREVIDEYGWRHFGEVYADHEAAYYTGPKPVISHFNNQYDLLYGSILQYLRTGDSRWQDLYEPLARHIFDIDIYHTTKDRPAYNGGLFWLTDHYKDAATCTHRTYSRANCPAKSPSSYGGGPSNEHNYTTGLLHYYYLTGERQAQAAVISLANWVIAIDASDENLLGLVDDGPTGLASKSRDIDYHGPGRGAGNSINALLDGWQLSGTRRYLDKAEELIRRCVHPADDIASRGLLDVENRWSYTVFLVVLARYLDLKAEAGELDYMYAYGRASLLHYAGWMVEHEEPYFDHPDKLEFPTETWAAQELRKANVLRLAAAHANEPLRQRLLRRGSELAQRAWHDLQSFASRYVTRAVALVLVEGLRDCYFRLPSAADKPRGPIDCDFGLPQDFVPQKVRVKAQLKSLRGLLKTLLHLARPRAWRILWSRTLGR